MLLYMLVYFPFEGFKNNMLNIYNECVIIAIYIAVFFINVFPTSEYTIEATGWVLIVAVLVSLLATWILLLPAACREVLNVLRSCFAKREGRKVVPEDSFSKAVPDKPKCKTIICKRVPKDEEMAKVSSSLTLSAGEIKDEKIIRKSCEAFKGKIIIVKESDKQLLCYNKQDQLALHQLTSLVHNSTYFTGIVKVGPFLPPQSCSVSKSLEEAGQNGDQYGSHPEFM
eukprot:TRINITY_DN2423_c0_g1_i1.p5 TRINITY_DN2423_c0_g1~~TRINITY_DN2423_c0_g1_i1.p5  ORF type:complete len:227 (-),score=5.23 TRINITY_DN2423_c0_g1_i1:179-859(-)